MSNILSLHGRPFASVLPTPVEPFQLVHHLRALWVSGTIGKDAYFLGCQVVAQAQAQRVRLVNLTHQNASNNVVRVAGSPAILTGPVTRERFQFIEALQELHFSVQLLNHFDAHQLDLSDAADRHFTRNPDAATADGLWSNTTPIFFKLPDIDAKEYAAEVERLFRDGLAHCTGAMEVRLQG